MGTITFLCNCLKVNSQRYAYIFYTSKQLYIFFANSPARVELWHEGFESCNGRSLWLAGEISNVHMRITFFMGGSANKLGDWRKAFSQATWKLSQRKLSLGLVALYADIKLFHFLSSPGSFSQESKARLYTGIKPETADVNDTAEVLPPEMFNKFCYNHF